MSENANKIYGKSKNFWKKVNVASYIFFLRLIGLWQSSSSPSIHHLNYLIFIITILNSIHQHLRLFSIHWKAMIFSIHWKAQIWKQVSFLLKVPNFLGVFARLCFPIPVHPLVWDWNSKIEDYPPSPPIAKCVTSHLVRILETLPAQPSFSSLPSRYPIISPGSVTLDLHSPLLSLCLHHCIFSILYVHHLVFWWSHISWPLASSQYSYKVFLAVSALILPHWPLPL